MKLLLDTHMVIWWADGDPALPSAVAGAILDPEHQVKISIVSLWEIALKRGMGKLRFDVPFEDLFLVAGFDRLDLCLEHLRRFEALPYHHRDPFDRLLIAQALDEGLTLATSDAKIALYDVPILK